MLDEPTKGGEHYWFNNIDAIQEIYVGNAMSYPTASACGLIKITLYPITLPYAKYTWSGDL